MQHEGSAPRDGIVVASGYGLKIYVDRGHLVVHDGVGRNRRTARLSRAASGLERLVVIGHTGFVTLEALRWIRDVGASFSQIGLDGEVIAVSSAERFHNTKLRRAQVQAPDSGVGLRAMRELVAAKVRQQLERVETLPQLWPQKPNGGNGQVAVDAVLRRELERISSAAAFRELRANESVAGRWYWQTLAGTTVTFERTFRKHVPQHWLTAGARTSPPSGFKSSRKAATPFHALINYAYAVLETEATIALQVHGLDPSLGLMHTDKRYRGSLAHDLMEPVRPVVDGHVIDLVGNYRLERGDVFETREGVCRLGPSLARQLSLVGPSFRSPLEDKAHQLVATLLERRTTNTPARRREGRASGKGRSRRTAPRHIGRPRG